MKYFFAGIGGARQQALVKLLLDMGHSVSGSDMQEFVHHAKLSAWGADVIIGHDAANLPLDTDVLVYSPAVPESNPERMKARTLGIKEIKNSALIGELMAGKRGVGIAGAHGKTTTTSLLFQILNYAGIDPSIVVGSDLSLLDGSGHLGQSDIMLTEACEFDRSFLDMNVSSAILTNIEADHLDYYKGGLPEIKEAYAHFVEKLSPQGFLVACGDSEIVKEVAAQSPARKIFYGIESSNDWKLVAVGRRGEMSLWQFVGPQETIDIAFPSPGRDLALDALGASLAARELGVTWEHIAKALEAFKATERRMEKIAETADVVLIDDYGHHPAEIASTVDALTEFYSERELYVVFQAHQIARTKNHWDDFVKVLGGIKHLAILPIFVVRDTSGEEAVTLAKELAEAAHAAYVADFDEATKWLEESAKPAVWLTLGAGKTNQLARLLLDKINK
jgi:UDP-N-acetylmuramate--alanine ligase